MAASAPPRNTIEYVFNAANKNASCDADGLRGFPIVIDTNATDEPNIPFRTQFPPAQVWNYDSTTGNFNGFSGSASFFLYDKQYTVKAVRIVNKYLHTNLGEAELQLWGSSSADNLSVLAVPLKIGASSMEGDRLQRMLQSAAETTDIAVVLPQGSDVPLFSYTSCAEYGIVNKKFEVTGQSSAKINCIFIGKPIFVAADFYKKYIQNTEKIQGIPAQMTETSWVFNELMDTDKNRTVKIVKKYDLSAEARRKAIFKKIGFTIPKKEGLKNYKVIQVDPNQLAQNNTYSASLDEAGGDLEAVLKKQAALKSVEIPVSTTGIKPKSIAIWLGVIIGCLLGIIVLMTIWYYGKKIFSTELPSTSMPSIKNQPSL
jgi:hypothetical protein